MAFAFIFSSIFVYYHRLPVSLASYVQYLSSMFYAFMLRASDFAQGAVGTTFP